MNPVYAFDRAAETSVRQKDKDGRLHVAKSHISKSIVNPYFGKEIPNYKALGLDPKKKYYLLRDPLELSKPETIASFNNLPILKKHAPLDAKNHDPSLVIGSTGTDCTWDAPYLDNSLVFWPQKDIDEIEKGEKKQLSSAYRYDPIMEPGEYEGTHYDGRMTNIRGSHVALVPEGRAGPDVMVGDSKSGMAAQEGRVKTKFSPAALTAYGALRTYLQPRLAEDAKISILPLLRDLTNKNFRDKLPALTKEVQLACDGKLAQDADLDDIAEILESLHRSEEEHEDHEDEEEVEDLDPNSGFPYGGGEEEESRDSPEMIAKVKHYLEGKISPEEMQELDHIIEEEENTMDRRRDADDRAARDRRDADDKRMADDKRRADDMWDRRADDARRRLGRDETPEEMEEREREQSSEDARHRMGRDESEEEREEREKGEGEDRRRRADDRRARADDKRRADDARRKADDKKRAKDEPSDFEGKPELVTAHDAQIMVDKAVRKATLDQRAIQDALRDVRPIVGDLSMAFDSADGVYEKALNMKGIETKGVHPSAYKRMLEMVPKGSTTPRPKMALDSAAKSDFESRFAGASRIRVM